MTMNLSQSTPDVKPTGSTSSGKIALWLLAMLFLCAAGARSLAGTPTDVPSVSGGMGPCTADFTVVDASNKPIYNAKIQVKVKFGFMAKHDTDLEVGTDSDGKARIEGLPDKIKKPPMDFTITSGSATKTVSNDPAANCHPAFAVTLGN
jgi:hypothetical protein